MIEFPHVYVTYMYYNRLGFAGLCQVELIAASNLPAGTLTRSVDPYAVITCGEDKLSGADVSGCACLCTESDVIVN